MKYQELPANLSRAYEIAFAGGHSIALIGPLNLREYMEGIKTLLPEVQFETPDKADILFEVTIPSPDYIKASRYNESKEDVLARTYGLNPVPPEINATCEQLLKTAINRLEFTPTDRDKVIALAQTISSLDKSDEIEIAHLAEAINYRAFTPEINGELVNVLIEVPEEATGSFEVKQIGDKFYREIGLTEVYINL